MSISRTKTWSANERLTFDQLNAVDTSATYALDKRGGQTDILSSSITVANAASLTYAAGSSLTLASGSSVTVSNGGTLTMSPGSSTILTGATVTSGTFSNPTITGNVTGGTFAGSTLSSPTLYGTMTGGFIHNMDMTLNTGHVLNLDAGSVIQRNGSSVLSLVGMGSSLLSTAVTTTATSYAAINNTPSTGVYVSLTCVAGDVLVIDSSMQAYNSTYQSNLKIVVTDPGVGGGSVQSISAARIIDVGHVAEGTFSTTYTVVGSGTVQIYGMALVLGGTTTIYGANTAAGAATLRVLQYRP